MQVNIPVREEATMWLLNDDGSAVPLVSFLTEQTIEDTDEFYDRGVLSYKKSSKVKAGYTVYKQGGSNRAR